MKRRIRKAIKEALKPDITFDEWAAENNIELPPVPPKLSGKRDHIIRWAFFSVASIFICLGVLLSFLLQDKPSGPVDPIKELPTYTSMDSISVNIEMEELYGIEGLLLFDTSQILDHGATFKDIADDDENLILLYAINDCIIVTRDEENAFNVEYLIRTYHKYEFSSYSKYLDLETSFEVNNIQVYYNIVQEGRNSNSAVVRFSYGDIDYFMRVTEFEGITKINEETIKILINDLLK